MNKIKPSLPKGMRDFDFDVISRRNYIFEIVKSAFERYSFLPIETPAMENIDTLTGKYGDEGDRLIFKVLNSGDYLSGLDAKSITNTELLTKKISSKALRYDLTIPFARFVVQNRNKITFPFKRYQIQNVWRADRPQKGRYREFYQCDADIIGTNSLLCEVELIQLCDDIFSTLKIPNVDICINNRKVLTAMIDLMQSSQHFDKIVVILDKFDKIGIDNVKKEILSLGLDESSLTVLNVFLQAKSINDIAYLLEKSEVGLAALDELKFIINNIEKVKLKSTRIKLDFSLARGLNYYTGSIFEIKVNNIDVGSLAGGGRYDNLTSIFGLKDMSGVGISFGIDRIYLVLEELNLFNNQMKKKAKVLFINFGINESLHCLSFVKDLRDAGISAELYPSQAKIKKQMTYANNKGVRYVVLFGENEMVSGKMTVKDMNDGSHNVYDIKELIKKII